MTKALIDQIKIGCFGLDPIDPLRLLLEEMIEALAQPKQKPVAYWIPKAEQFCFASPTGRPFAKAWEPLYTSPPQRTWVGLTDDEMEATFIQCGGKWNGDFWKIEDADFHPFLRSIEAKLKEKNT